MKDDDITNCEFFLDNYFTNYKVIKKLPGDRNRNCNTINGANQIIESKNALNVALIAFIVETIGKVQRWVKGYKNR